MPLAISFCTTIHKVQALTLDKLVWVLGTNFMRAIGYVAASRARTRAGLHVVANGPYKKFSVSDMNKCPKEFFEIHELYVTLRKVQRLEARRIAEQFVNSNWNNFSLLPIPSNLNILVDPEEKEKIAKQKENRKQRALKKLNEDLNNIANNDSTLINYNKCNEIITALPSLNYGFNKTPIHTAQTSNIPISTQLAMRHVTLTHDEVVISQNLLRQPFNEDLVISKFNIPMSRLKISCLKPETWLNDEVINFYMEMLQARDTTLCERNSSRLSSHFFNSFFIEKLLETDGQYTFVNVSR